MVVEFKNLKIIYFSMLCRVQLRCVPQKLKIWAK